MTPPCCTIRVATAADAQAVAEVYLASRRAFLAFAPLAHPEAEVRRWIAATVVASGRVLIAGDGQLVVGMASWSSTRGPVADVFWLDHLYLRPGHTGQGVGAVLRGEVLHRCGRPLRLFTFAANLGARRFYERHGFRVLRRGDGSDNEERCPDVLYELAC